MTKNIFISYSRRELGFVDDLVSKLEGENYNVWLDYRALIPGSPWDVQIEKGLGDSDTVLLVVSKAALASKYVTSEWHHFLDKKQRVILLIFEAVDLPKELEKYEWVDFRGSYKAGLKELFSQLKQPIQENHPVPETGFKAPWIVWAAILVSVLVAVLSLFEYWTLFIPWFLVPLPYRIYKRDFNFTQIQTALWALPIASLLSVIVYDDRKLDILVWLGLIFGMILLFILRSAGMQRWGKPEAIIPKYIDPRDPKIQNPSLVPFYVDYAVQDRVIAEDLTTTLKKYGHLQVENIQDAKAVFALISQFKSDSDAVPEKQMLFPILIQTNNNISKNLSRIQWIDFRPGVRGLDTIAQLLSHPKELLKALGMRPVSSQTVYSPLITALYYFISLVAIVSVGASLHYMFKTSSGLLSQEFIGLITIIISFLGLAFFMVKGLTSRKGLFSGVMAILLGIIVLGALMFWQKSVNTSILNETANATVNETAGESESSVAEEETMEQVTAEEATTGEGESAASDTEDGDALSEDTDNETAGESESSVAEEETMEQVTAEEATTGEGESAASDTEDGDALSEDTDNETAGESESSVAEEETTEQVTAEEATTGEGESAASDTEDGDALSEDSGNETTGESESSVAEEETTEQTTAEEATTDEGEGAASDTEDETALSEDLSTSDSEITMSDYVIATGEELSFPFLPGFKLYFVDVVQYMYFLGIVVTGFIYLRNKHDIKHWFPAKK